MGAGGSLEAAFSLAGPIKAGSWHLVGDGIIIASTDVTFDVIWRKAGGGDTTLVSFTHHFDSPTGAGAFDAVPYQADAAGIAAAAKANDKLVLRITAQGDPTQSVLYIPNGDQGNAQGLDPSLTLPP